MADYEDAKATFERLLYEELIPAFCSDPQRRCDRSTFVAASNHLGELDSRDFMEAWNAGFMEHSGRGLYRTVNGGASEQFFWTGRNVPGRRSFTLWMEPLITVAALGRLHRRYDWPKRLLRAQSVDWAFDLVAMRPGESNEYIAGEIKKTRCEVDHLVELMEHFGCHPDLAEPAKSGKARNAYKKMAALRLRRAPIFWAVGPDGYSRIFNVTYDGGGVSLSPDGDALLKFMN